MIPLAVWSWEKWNVMKPPQLHSLLICSIWLHRENVGCSDSDQCCPLCSESSILVVIWSKRLQRHPHSMVPEPAWAARGRGPWVRPAPPARGSRGGSPSSRSWGTPSGGRRRVTASAAGTWRATAATMRMSTRTSSSITRMTSSSGSTSTSATTTTSGSNTRSLRTLTWQEFALKWSQPKCILACNKNFIGYWARCRVNVNHNCLHQIQKFQNIHQH